MLIAATVRSSTPSTWALTSFSLSAVAALGNRNLSAGSRTSFTFLGGGAGGGGGGGGGATRTGASGPRRGTQATGALRISPNTRKILTVEFTVISRG